MTLVIAGPKLEVTYQKGACGGNRKTQVGLLFDNCPINTKYSILCACSLPFLGFKAL